jgi:hypothetical protein
MIDAACLYLKQEFIPFLEKYFEYNAYPSVADHAAMAKKSMMEPRQIKVWVGCPIPPLLPHSNSFSQFQNHRKRAKDEGLSFRRLSATDPAPLELCLRSMEEKMEPYLIPDGLRQEVDSEVSEPGSDDEEDDDDFDSAQPEVILPSALGLPAEINFFADCKHHEPPRPARSPTCLPPQIQIPPHLRLHHPPRPRILLSPAQLAAQSRHITSARRHHDRRAHYHLRLASCTRRAARDVPAVPDPHDRQGAERASPCARA